MTVRLSHFALCLGLAVSLVACGGQLAGANDTPPGMTPQNRAHDATTQSSTLYIGRYSKDVDMLTYPGLQPVGSFTYPNDRPFGQPCPDDLTGTIYFPNPSGQPNYGLLEYEDGGTAPIGSLKPPFGRFAVNCAVDATTGNIAVVLATKAATSSYVGVYAPGSSKPTKYEYPNLRWYASCRYDGSGDLFVLGETNSFEPLFLELAKGGKNLMKVSLTLKASLAPLILWDGSYITVESLNKSATGIIIYRLSISGSTATVVGKTGLQRARIALWIQGDNTVIAARAPKNDSNNRDVGFYDYPGGRLTRIFAGLPNRKNSIQWFAVATPASGFRAR